MRLDTPGSELDGNITNVRLHETGDGHHFALQGGLIRSKRRNLLFNLWSQVPAPFCQTEIPDSHLPPVKKCPVGTCAATGIEIDDQLTRDTVPRWHLLFRPQTLDATHHPLPLIGTR